MNFIPTPKSAKWSMVALVTVFMSLLLVDSALQFGDGVFFLDPSCPTLVSWLLFIRNTVAFGLIFPAIVLLAGRFGRFIAVPAFLFVAVTHFASYYARSTYGVHLGNCWLPLLITTDPAEIRDFISISATPAAVAGLVAALAALAYASAFVWRLRYPAWSAKTLLAALLLASPYLSWKTWTKATGEKMWASTTCMEFVVGTVFATQDLIIAMRAADAPQIPQLAEADLCAATGSAALGGGGDEKSPVAAIVVGESGARRHWHLYGYQRDTTPCMDALAAEGELTVFKDVIVFVPGTLGSLRLALLDTPLERSQEAKCTIAQVLAAAGWHTASIETGHKNSTDLIDLLLTSGCVEDIRQSGGDDTARARLLAECLARNPSEPVAAIIHMSGTHFPVRGCYPPEEEVWPENLKDATTAPLSEEARKMVNRYDNAIRYEDKALGAIVQALRDSGRPAIMIHFSDHGETPRSGTWRLHTDPGAYEIPFVVWMSPSFRKLHPDLAAKAASAANLKLSLDEMFHGIAELCLVRFADPATANQSFLGADFHPRTPRLADGKPFSSNPNSPAVQILPAK